MVSFMIGLNEFLKMRRQMRLTVIDIRDRTAYEKSHIPGALSLPFEDNPDFFKLVPKQGTLVICCYRGNLSARVTRLLRQNGINAYSLAGGYEVYRSQMESGLHESS